MEFAFVAHVNVMLFPVFCNYCRFQKRNFEELQEKFLSGTQRYRKMKKRGHFRNK